jgi:DNA repair ATPase RecN
MWDWPGARWWRCDLHLHSPASEDFKDPDATAEQWIAAAREAGLDVVAVTDHDSGQWVDRLRAAARENAPVIFAGVEATSAEGIHVLCLLGEAAGSAPVDHLLSKLDVGPSERGLLAAKSSKHIEELLTTAADLGWLCIPAHANAEPSERNPSTASLMTNLAARPAVLKQILDRPELAAVEVCGEDPAHHAEMRGVGPDVQGRTRREPGLALLRFSDAHRLSEIGRRSTWVKMTSPTREGLELALSDGEHSVQVHALGFKPNRPPALAIEDLFIKDLQVAGRGGPLRVRFNPWLTVIIGGRGAGKSTLVNALRLALRREADAAARPESDFARFATIGSRRKAGALTEKSEIAVGYRRDGLELRANWRVDASDVALEARRDDGAWSRAEGTVAQRLPVRILGQGELNELAEDPGRILQLIDETPQVGRRAWQDRWDAEEASYLALRAQAREVQASLRNSTELRGELDDVMHSLGVLESPEHRDTLRRYQQTRQQARELERWHESLRQTAERLRAAVEEAGIEDPPVARFDGDADQSMREAMEARRSASADALSAVAITVDLLEGEAGAGLDPAVYTAFQARLLEAEEAYGRLSAELSATGAPDPARYGELVQQRHDLELRLKAVGQTQERVEKLRTEAEEALRRLKALRSELSVRRQGFLESVSADSEHVQFKLIALGDREGAGSQLRELLLGDRESSSFGPSIEACVEPLRDEYGTEEESQAAVARVKRLMRTGEGVKIDARFVSRIQDLKPETQDRFDLWFPADRLEVSYEAAGKWKAIEQGSTGQKNAAILSFLLSYGEEPLVVDQPENDLDNALISDLVVRQLRASKARRQLIVVTHNPNVVVNADADYVVGLEFKAGQVQVTKHGGLQEQAIRDEVCRVVEGGREAFESRYSRIGERHVRHAG